MKKIFMYFIIMLMLVCGVYFLLELSVTSNKQEKKVTIHRPSDDLPNEMGRKRSTVEDIYIPLDAFVYKISDTEIANFINSSLPLNPWLIDPDTLKCGDTITWNCKAKGFANNPRIGVTDGHHMWLIARELLEFMHGVSRPNYQNWVAKESISSESKKSKDSISNLVEKDFDLRLENALAKQKQKEKDGDFIFWFVFFLVLFLGVSIIIYFGNKKNK